LRLAVEPKSKKVIDLWNEGEHNRSSRLKKTTGSTVNKVSRDGKKLLTSKAKGSITAPRD